jgi:hypothetical protein
MSEEDSPLVQEAIALLNDTNYPLRTRITETFFDTVNADNSGQKNLENAVALVSGALNGVLYITKSFSRQEDKIENQEPIDRSKILSIIGVILTIFEQANTEFPITNKQKKKAQWTIGTYIGAILYDIHTLICSESIQDVISKWKNYIVMVRKETKNAKEAIEIKGAQNINPDKLKRKSYKVGIYVKEERIVTEDELQLIKHTYTNEYDDCSDESDEEEGDGMKD